MSERPEGANGPPEPTPEELEEILGNLDFFLEMEEATVLPLEEDVDPSEGADDE